MILQIAGIGSAVIRHGIGVDLLIHVVCAAPPEVLQELQSQAVMDDHTSPEEAGTVFACANPKMAAYSGGTRRRRLILDESGFSGMTSPLLHAACRIDKV